MNAIAPEPGSREQIIAELTPLVSAYIVGKKKVPVRVATVRRIIEHLKKPIGVEEEGVLTRRECGVAASQLTVQQAFETSGKERLMPTRYTHSTCLAFGTDGEADYCELDVTVSYAVAWGSPETGAGYLADPYKYDPGSPDEVEDIRLELVDGRPITGCEFIEPVLSRFEEDDDLREALLEEARQREAAWAE